MQNSRPILAGLGAALLSTLGSAASLYAQPVWRTDVTSRPLSISAGPTSDAQAFLRLHSGELELEAVELTLRRELRGAGGSTIVRFDQTLDGVRVRGREVIVQLDRAGRVVRVILNVDRQLERGTLPNWSRAQAEAVVEGRVQHKPSQSELVLTAAGGGSLVWEVDAWDADGASRYFVDADTGELSGPIPIAMDALGRVFAINPIDTPTPVDVALTTLDLTADPVRLASNDGLVRVTQHVSGNFPDLVVEQTLGPTSGQDFLYDPPLDPLDTSDAFAQVNAFHQLARMRSFGAALGLPVDSAPWQLVVVTNLQRDDAPFDNAFFVPLALAGPITAPSTIAIGQGSMMDFAYDSDVVLHEVGHYLTYNAVGYNLGAFHVNEYGRSPHSASIDEGIADYLACSENDDAQLGEAVLAPFNAVRDLEDTSKRCPGDMVGEPHGDGEIIGSFSWSLRTLLGRALADELVWGAVATLPAGATFGDFGRAIESAADAMVSSSAISATERMTIETELVARGLDECDHVIPIEPGETKVEVIYGLTDVGESSGYTCTELQDISYTIPGLFHFSRQTETSDALLRVVIEAEAMGDGAPQLTVYLQKGQPVVYDGDIFGIDAVQFDEKIDLEGASSAIVLDGVDFEPGAEYFFVVENRGCPQLRLSLTTETSPANTTTSSVTTTTSAGTTSSSTLSANSTSSTSSGAGGLGGEGGGGQAEQSGDDGCSCRLVAPAGPGSRATSVWLFLAALVLLAKRRTARLEPSDERPTERTRSRRTG